jgi:hypothetical protein
MRFINKHSQDINPQKKKVDYQGITDNKKPEVMKDKISMVEDIINDIPAPAVKRIKKDKGLIERTESSKTILTEDNKQLLVD